jgi:hypothetical protein
MRDDVSDKLVHLTKGTGSDAAKHREEAAAILVNILDQRKLVGGTGFIKGSHKCVCFSEAPIGKLAHILAIKENEKFKYQPYGIIVGKRWLFEKEGRPVIYGPDADYAILPDTMKHRHVRFDLGKQDIDYTWQREWRIKTDTLQIAPPDVTVVVPDRSAKEAFAGGGFTDWHYIALSDLGVKIDPL